MKTKLENGALTLYLEGRVDSSNVIAVEQEIDKVLSDKAFDTLIIDAECLEYISSAGLRMLLKLRKRYGSLRVINVNADVYDIFDMTGFTEIMTVEKAYRLFDITGCELIGEGANGLVYRVGKETIIKVYKDASALEDIKRERELARTALILGVPTAISYDVVKVGQTYGSMFELLDAKSFAELLRDDPDKLEFIASETVKLMRALHTTKAPAGLSLQSDIAKGWLEEARDIMDDAHFARLTALIEAIPETGTMIHGDLHIKNIMLQNDEALLIDMDTLCTGNPVYELAFIYNAYKGFGVADSGVIRRFLGVDASLAYTLLRRILALYLDTQDAAVIDRAEEKISVIGLLRVLRRAKRFDDDENRRLLDVCRDRLYDKIDGIDSLVL